VEYPIVRRFLVRHCDRERVVEIENGPFKMFANDPNDYYEGWVMPEQLDPYGEPYKVIFTADRIVKKDI
jgi:hypothetical protein